VGEAARGRVAPALDGGDLSGRHDGFFPNCCASTWANGDGVLAGIGRGCSSVCSVRVPPGPVASSNWVSPTATTTTRSRGPRASEPTTLSAGLLAPPRPGMRLASQPSSRMKPITSSNVTTVVPTMPAPVCGVPKDAGAAWVLVVLAKGDALAGMEATWG